MSDSDLETLIRQAVAAEAAESVHPGAVLAELERRRRPRRRAAPLIAATGLAAAVAVLAVAVPLTEARDTPPAPVATVPVAASNVLLIGLDDTANADSIVLTRVSGDGALSAVSLPRDSAVEVPGRGVVPLRSVYSTAHEEALGRGLTEDAADAEGARSLAETVETLTGTEIDHHASVDVVAFGRLATAFGGVEVCLNASAADRYSGVDLPAGRQTLTGPQVLAFLRQRSGLPNGDLDRVRRHQAVLTSLATTAVASGVLTDPAKLAAVLSAVHENVRTDEGWNPADLLRGLTAAPVRTTTIPVGDGAELQGGGQGLEIDPAAVRAHVQDFLEPAPGGEPSAAEPPGETSCVD
ncbi:LCP family protein [Umezawaea beigongshangensis]|uniref:LCP family protein n=1 Tax=Umezawaea beigongshangensis TaxID=2780383 RepID=UPI0018F12060|nr:LCP family protein [Umezawaea beigongshangensis]